MPQKRAWGRVFSYYSIVTGRGYCFEVCCLVNHSGKVTLSLADGIVKYCATAAVQCLKLELACDSKHDALGVYVFTTSFSISCPPMPNCCRKSHSTSSMQLSYSCIVCMYMYTHSVQLSHSCIVDVFREVQIPKRPCHFLFQSSLQFIIYRKWVLRTNYYLLLVCNTEESWVLRRVFFVVSLKYRRLLKTCHLATCCH